MSSLSELKSRNSTAEVADFRFAQQRVLDRYDVAAEARFVRVPALDVRAQVLVAGEGPPLPMVIGGTIPAVFWAPLMAKLSGRTLYAIELPGFGLTEPLPFQPATFRSMAVTYLGGVLDALGLGDCDIVSNSMGSLWTTWLAVEQPTRVRSQVMIGCPAFLLGTAATPPMRLASVPGVGPVMTTLLRPSARGTERIMASVGEDPNGLAELRDVLTANQRLPEYAPSMVAMLRSVMAWTRPRAAIALTADQLREVTHPVRLVWGQKDPFGSVEVGRRAAGLMPEADFHLVRGGHVPWFHEAEQVAGLVQDFLETRASAADQDGP